MQSINPKSYFYEIIADGEEKGIIGYNVISMMNEYKLADLHYLCEKEFLNEALSLLLNDEQVSNFLNASNKSFIVKLSSNLVIFSSSKYNVI